MMTKPKFETNANKNQKVAYWDQHTALEGHVFYPSNVELNLNPGVLVFHAWRGQDDFSRGKAEELANLGYVGFAADIYGKGVHVDSSEEAAQLMQPYMADRSMLQGRILMALNTVRELPGVDPDRIAAIGFCFGGLCALDLARSGATIRGAVSFHGLLGPSGLPRKNPITARILALHGHNDPLATPDQVLAFEKEMTEAEVDWQLHAYSKTVHAFTLPTANDPKAGMVYNPLSAKRSWIAMKNFLEEVLLLT